ncbi:unnamed protein product [Rhodiola kirilowii]
MGSRAKQLMPDVVALAMNVIGSVGFILVNKQLMSVYGYDFGYATTLAGIHLAITALMRIVPNTTRPLALKFIPPWEILWLSLVANTSIAGLYLSLMLNSVEFYQISKLSTIPIVCVMEWILHNKHYSREAKMSVLVVMTGVGACTVSEMKDNTKGFLCACLAALSTSFQQIYMGSLQKKYSVGRFELMSKTAPIQAVTLLLLGPFIDYYVSGIFLTDNKMSVGAVMFVFLSYTLAVFCNITQYFQYLFIGQLHSVTLDSFETVSVLILGWVLCDTSPTLKSILAVTVAVVGSVLYSWAVKVENQRLSTTKDFRSMDKILAENETTMVKEEAGTKPVTDIEHGETNT